MRDYIGMKMEGGHSEKNISLQLERIYDKDIVKAIMKYLANPQDVFSKYNLNCFNCDFCDVCLQKNINKIYISLKEEYKESNYTQESLIKILMFLDDDQKEYM